VLRDQIIAILTQEQAELSTSKLCEKLGHPCSAEDFEVVEALLMFSPEIQKAGGSWKLVKKGRTARILTAIENYADATGRKIFRLSAALADLPPHEHPTEEELRHALEASHGRFQILPNAMIKRNE
jgi:hypothetical protein